MCINVGLFVLLLLLSVLSYALRFKLYKLCDFFCLCIQFCIILVRKLLYVMLCIFWASLVVVAIFSSRISLQSGQANDLPFEAASGAIWSTAVVPYWYRGLRYGFIVPSIHAR